MSIRAEHLSFAYGSHAILRDVSFAVPGGALVSLVGPNGAGKTTLLRCLLGLLRGYRGEVWLDGRPVHGMDVRRRARLAAYIPQAHASAFAYSVLDTVLMGMTARLAPLASPGAAEREAAMQALARLGIASLADRDAQRLSGGEAQLVLIARALAQQARILIMDEPTANLDYGNQLRVLKAVRGLARDGYTVLLSTHHPGQACLFSSGVLAMLDGRIIADGPPEAVMTPALMRTLYGANIQVGRLGGAWVCAPADLPDRTEMEEPT